MPPKRKRPQDSDPDYSDSSTKRREIFWQTSSAPSLRRSKLARHPKREGTPNSLQMIFKARSSFIGSKSTSGLNGMMVDRRPEMGDRIRVAKSRFSRSSRNE
ncbi:hypothetical protein DFH09DRAFT_1078646 [Mycena vulgaris]|nr:hypothetical protein DFH09DRAFT_1078646 [Mycena vulgaris]